MASVVDAPTSDTLALLPPTTPQPHCDACNAPGTSDTSTLYTCDACKNNYHLACGSRTKIPPKAYETFVCRPCEETFARREQRKRVVTGWFLASAYVPHRSQSST